MSICQACTRGFHKHHSLPCQCEACVKPVSKPMPSIVTYALLGSFLQERFVPCNRFVPSPDGQNCVCGEGASAHSPGALLIDSFLSNIRKGLADGS